MAEAGQTRPQRPALALATLLVVPFCVMTGTGMMFPLLAVIAERDGGGQSGAGILLASFAAARLAANVPAGMAADRFGRRGVIAMGLAVLVAGSLGAYWALGLAASALCIVLLGAGSSTALTATLAALTDLSGAGNRGRMMSRYQTAVLVGISLGPVTGGILSTRWGLAVPFLLQAALALAALALALLFAPRPRAATTAAAAPAGGEGGAPVLPMFLTVGFGVLGILSFTLFMTRTATSWQIVPIVARERFAMDHEAVGLLLTVGALANLMVLPAIGTVIDRLGAAASILAGGIAMALSFLLVRHDGLGALWAGMILMGIASGLLAPSLNTFAVEIARAGYGTTLGALRTAGDAGLVLGPLILGPVLALLGVSHEAGLAASAAAMAVATALFVAVHGRRLGRPGEPEG